MSFNHDYSINFSFQHPSVGFPEWRTPHSFKRWKKTAHRRLHTSIAGNTYFNAISLTDDFVVKENVGVGWLHTFLNGLQIYTHDGKLVAERDFQCFIYSEERVLKEVTDMLTEAIVKAAQRQGIPLNQTQVRNEVFHRVRKVKRLR